MAKPMLGCTACDMCALSYICGISWAFLLPKVTEIPAHPTQHTAQSNHVVDKMHANTLHTSKKRRRGSEEEEEVSTSTFFRDLNLIHFIIILA